MDPNPVPSPVIAPPRHPWWPVILIVLFVLLVIIAVIIYYPFTKVTKVQEIVPVPAPLTPKNLSGALAAPPSTATSSAAVTAKQPTALSDSLDLPASSKTSISPAELAKMLKK